MLENVYQEGVTHILMYNDILLNMQKLAGIENLENKPVTGLSSGSV